jgi:hypothetical protein
MQINEIYDLVSYILNKDVNGRQLRSTDFNRVCAAVNTDMFKLKYGLPEEYQPGRPLPRQAWEITQKMSDDLRQCKVRMGGGAPLLQVYSDGRADIPSDYIHYSSMGRRYISARGILQHAKVDVVFDHQVDERLSNPNRTPTYRTPICVFYSDYMQFYPAESGWVDFTYLRLPEAPYYATTINQQTDLEEYDETNSTQLEWAEDLHMDFVKHMLAYVGMNLRSGDVVQYAEMKKKEGV